MFIYLNLLNLFWIFFYFTFFLISFLWTVHQKSIAGNNCHLSFCPTTSIVLTTITNIYVPRCIRIYMLNDPGSVAVCACAWWLRERLVDRLAPSTSRWEHACVSFSWDIFVIVGLCNDLDCYIYICLMTAWTPRWPPRPFNIQVRACMC